MLPPIPVLKDYGLSETHGFLPTEPPLPKLPDPRYEAWETIVANLSTWIRSADLHRAIDRLPVLGTDGLKRAAEWRRAYCLLCFMMQGYVWAGDRPRDRVPSQIVIPLLSVSDHLNIIPAPTYAALCLWNYAPVRNGSIGDLETIVALNTFTGSTDESWFYSVSVAIEFHGAPILGLGLRAVDAARHDDSITIASCLDEFADRLAHLTNLLVRIYEGCNPSIFYHKIRPFLAGSKNMAESGLPSGVMYEDGSGSEPYRQYSGGSNAQSSLIQFFDVVLGIEHSPTRISGSSQEAKSNFIHNMRRYMPTHHASFLRDVEAVANIRDYVGKNMDDRKLRLAYDACVARLHDFRSKHIGIVTRYIIIPSARLRPKKYSPTEFGGPNVAVPPNQQEIQGQRGTGGTLFLPFLKQARDETCVPVPQYAKRRQPASKELESVRENMTSE